MKRTEEAEGEDKGPIWKLPVVRSNQLGKVGPAFGIGAGCGVGFGVGLLGGINQILTLPPPTLVSTSLSFGVFNGGLNIPM